MSIPFIRLLVHFTNRKVDIHTSMLFFVSILSFSCLSVVATTVFDNNLRLYDSFAEIHQVYNGPLRFQQAEWDNIKHESLILRSFSNDTNQTKTFERRILRLNVNSSGVFDFLHTQRLTLAICFR